MPMHAILPTIGPAGWQGFFSRCGDSVEAARCIPFIQQYTQALADHDLAARGCPR